MSHDDCNISDLLTHRHFFSLVPDCADDDDVASGDEDGRDDEERH